MTDNARWRLQLSTWVAKHTFQAGSSFAEFDRLPLKAYLQHPQNMSNAIHEGKVLATGLVCSYADHAARSDYSTGRRT
jgi:hypothetical protein